MTGGLAVAVTAELLLRATLLVGVAWASAALLRKAGASASVRHVVWLLGIAALLALPLLWGLMPSLRLPVLPMGAESAAGLASPSPLALAASAPAGSPSFDEARAGGWAVVLPLAYTLVVVVLLLRLVIGRLMLVGLWRDADPVREAGWERLLARLSREAFLSRPVQLRFARGPAMPMTWGTLAPKVLLPAEAQAWPAERRRLVLLHELAHVARRDSLSRSAAALACALYWIHPAVWFAAREMRMEQEQAADDRVLIAGASPRAYARSLLDLATQTGGRPQLEPAASMAGACQLERRLLSITMPARRDRITLSHLSASTAFAGLVTLVMAVGIPVSVSSARLSTLPATPLGSSSPKGHGPASAPDKVRAEDEAPAPALVSDGLARPTAQSSIASQRRPMGNEFPVELQEEAGRDRAVADVAAPIDRYEARSGLGPGPAASSARPLIYADWQLPPRNSNGLGNGAAATPSSGYSGRAERVALPPAPDADSGERAERRKPAAFALRVVGPTNNRSGMSSPPGTVALTWFLETTKR